MGIAVVLLSRAFSYSRAAGHMVHWLVLSEYFAGTPRPFPILGVVLNVLPIAILFLLGWSGSLRPQNSVHDIVP